MSGFTVASYASGDAFLAEAKQPKLGCLVLDFHMPGLNGLETLKRARLLGWTLPAVFVTGHHTAPLEDQTLRSGACAFLSKPVDPSILIRTIEKALIDEPHVS